MMMCIVVNVMVMNVMVVMMMVNVMMKTMMEIGIMRKVHNGGFVQRRRRALANLSKGHRNARRGGFCCGGIPDTVAVRIACCGCGVATMLGRSRKIFPSFAALRVIPAVGSSTSVAVHQLITSRDKGLEHWSATQCGSVGFARGRILLFEVHDHGFFFGSL